MRYNSENAGTILRLVEGCLSESIPADVKIRKVWWTLLFSRARALSNGVRQISGDQVLGGVFKGMTLTNAALELYRAPYLLGCYEHELHQTVEKLIAGNYTRILNIGCSVGYYAVGLALRMPHVTVEAFDISADAQKNCADLARLNGVQDRIHISGLFDGEKFASYADGKTLVVMDIEGGEKDLLDPVRFPALQKMDVLVELHDLIDPTISPVISDRFAASHTAEFIRNRNVLPDASVFLPEGQYLDPFDHLLLGWEGRDGETPWGVFTAKA